MNKLNELIHTLCPDGVEYKKIKDVFQRLRGTPITAGKMKEIESLDGDIRVFAGGKTLYAISTYLPTIVFPENGFMISTHRTSREPKRV